MPLNDNNEYEVSNEFERNLKKYISKYLYPQINGCTKKQYEKILTLLSEIEVKFYEQNYISNDDRTLTFEDKRDKKAKDMQQYASCEILRKLQKFQRKLIRCVSNKESQDWIKYEPRENETIRMIWKTWCYEREHCPRAGIIFIYFDKLDSIEVLLTKYYKNNYIQYGYAKGKMEIGEDVWNCAVREVAEELGLDGKFIYNLIQNSLPIKKNVFINPNQPSIEHYYFIVRLSTKNIDLKLNPEEIDDVEWHNIYTLPCSTNCQIKQSMQSKHNFKEPNYFMVTCTDRYQRNSLVQDILIYIDKMNKNETVSQKYGNIHRSCCYN